MTAEKTEPEAGEPSEPGGAAKPKEKSKSLDEPKVDPGTGKSSGQGKPAQRSEPTKSLDEPKADPETGKSSGRGKPAQRSEPAKSLDEPKADPGTGKSSGQGKPAQRSEPAKSPEESKAEAPGSREEAAPQEEVPAVSIRNLDKVFRSRWGGEPVHAVKNLSLEVKAGEVYGLIGPNGSGKSTTMKVLLGLISATSGETAIFGVDSRQVESRRFVGFLPENPYLYRHLTGLETLKFYADLSEVPKSVFAERSEELLELVGLTFARNRRLAGYSKGMLQRIGLAQALIHDPKLVVLDEPTAGVDPAGSKQIRDLIFELKRRGISVILSSHLLEQVQEVCDRVGIIFQGDLVREGDLNELISVSGQTEMILEGASPELVRRIVKEVEGDGARVLSHGRPRTTLEELFLKATGGESKDASKK